MEISEINGPKKKKQQIAVSMRGTVLTVRTEYVADDPVINIRSGREV